MEWFKFRMSWRKPVLMLTDEEAGKVFKALVTYVYSEEEQETGGRGDILLCQMTEVLQEDLRQYREKAEKKELVREKRRAAGLKSGEVRKTKSTNVQHVFTDVQPHEQMFEGVHVCSDLFDKNKNTEERNTEEEKEGEEEREEEAAELPVLTIPLSNGSEHPLFRRDIDEYSALYPAADILQELRCMRGWCLANPARRKTKRGVKAFISNWLNKAQREAKPAVPDNPFLAYATGEAEIGDDIL